MYFKLVKYYFKLSQSKKFFCKCTTNLNCAQYNCKKFKLDKIYQVMALLNIF